MKTFTGFEYLLIDAANNFGNGIDKTLLEERVQWGRDNLHQLEALTEQAKQKTQPLYRKAVMAIRKAQQGIPTGHLVGLDASCSGVQIMSAMSGCMAGARATNLVDPDVFHDAYTETTDVMNENLGGTLRVSRDDAKDALMTSCYGSKKRPKDIFGTDTPELKAFYAAVLKVAPGAWELLQDLLKSWRPFALQHSWKLPDGFDARVKVMEKKETRIEIDELGHASFTYEYYENQGTKEGLSNVANVVHSVDAYVLRSMHRRCNYDRDMVLAAANLILEEQMQRSMQAVWQPAVLKQAQYQKVAYYVEQYERSGVADVVILPYLDMATIQLLSTQHLEQLHRICTSMLAHPPFALVTVHDAFASHPNHCNHVRNHYRNILAEIAESDLVSDLLSQLHGTPGKFKKLGDGAALSKLIRECNYALS